MAFQDQKQYDLDQEEVRELNKEFSVIDLNNDGRVSREEMLIFLAKKNIDEDHRGQIVDELFSKCDVDGDGEVDIGEFTAEYIETKNQLKGREAELKQTLLEHHKAKLAAQKELEAMKRALGRNYVAGGPLGTLNLTIQSVGGLQTGAQPVVCRVTQGNLSHTTQSKPGPDAQFREPVILKVEDQHMPVNITCELKSGMRQLFSHDIPFDEILDESREQEFSNKTEIIMGMTLNFSLSYAQNRTAQLSYQIANLQEDLAQFSTLMQQVQIFIQQLSSPFGFLNKQIKDIQTNMAKARKAEYDAEQMGDHRYHAQEKEAEAKFDDIVGPIFAQAKKDPRAAQLGVSEDDDDIPWGKILFGVLNVQFVLTVFSMLTRPCFLSLTCLTLGMFSIYQHNLFSREYFRYLVVGLLINAVYDFLWLMIINSAEADDEEDGGKAYLIRRISLLFAYIAFFFRIIVILTFWKVSLNYRQYMRAMFKESSAGSMASGRSRQEDDEEDDIEMIMSQYGMGNSP